MTAFDPFNLPALRCADDRTLELHRHLLCENADAGREPVIDELLDRGLPVLASSVTRRGALLRLAHAQIMSAVEEATSTLMARLRRPERLQPIAELADELAADAVNAREPEDAEPPKLAARRPDLRELTPQIDSAAAEADDGPPPDATPTADPVNDKLGDELRRNRIKRNHPENS